jgi:hypothetical protein
MGDDVANVRLFSFHIGLIVWVICYKPAILSQNVVAGEVDGLPSPDLVQ